MWHDIGLPILLTVVAEIIVVIILAVARQNSARARAFWDRHWPSVFLAAIVIPLLMQIEWSLTQNNRAPNQPVPTALSAQIPTNVSPPPSAGVTATQPAVVEASSPNAPIPQQPTNAPLVPPTSDQNPPTVVASPSSGSPSCDDAGDIELLSQPWTLSASGGNADEPPLPYQQIDANVLQGKDMLRVKINLNKATFGEGDRKDESAIVLDQQGHWFVASVVSHGIANGADGEQVIYISLEDFEELDDKGYPDGKHLDLSKSVGPLHARFWNINDFKVQLNSIVACNSQPGI